MKHTIVLLLLLLTTPLASFGASISAYPTKALPIGTDKLLIADAEDSWKTKAVLFSYFASANNPTFSGVITVPGFTGATYTGTNLLAAIQAALTELDGATDVNASTFMLGVLEAVDAAAARTDLDVYSKAEADAADDTGTDDQTAAEVPFTPAGSLVSTTVQAAIEEVAGGASVDLTAPGPIGSVTPNSGAFTTLTAEDIASSPPAIGETGELGLPEDPANGTNELILKAPANLATDVVITLPTGVVPATATTACTAGQWWYDSSYWYVCVATSTWKRAALATW